MSTAYGIGLATVTPDGTVLDTWYPSPVLGETTEASTTRLSSTEIAEALGESAA